VAYIGTFQIGVLGLGAMGSRIAARLLLSGHTVTVFNRTASAMQALCSQGAHAAATPREAAQGADFVLGMVRDDVASRAVWTDTVTGALAGMQADAVAIDCSTLTPQWAAELADQCVKRKTPFLHVPVAGSRPQADAGQLILLAGGDADVLRRADLLFEAIGVAVHHVGNAASAAMLKLLINAQFGIQVASLAELLGLARRAGVDPVKALEVFSATPVASPAAKAACTAMLAEAFAPMFPINLVEKDSTYLLAASQVAGCKTPVAERAMEVFQTAHLAGWGEQNITAVARLY
jgi:3-hydroxyisobutyrate dehydrogenase